MKFFRMSGLPPLLLASITSIASAHHSYAMYEVQRTLTLTGTVKTWEWTNPHSWLVMTAPDAQGKEAEWHIEGSSPAVFRRYGMNRDVIKPGDQVTVLIHPLRSGANGGQLQTLTTPAGKTFDVAAPPP